MLHTVNELLSLSKAVRSRLNSLENLRDKVSIETLYLDSKEKVIKPQYDVKAVDKKIVELQTFLFKADSRIKQQNAVTKIEISADVDDLLAPLE